ncbi:MAG: C-terminal helicase domain-containing protein, partial [Sphaerochaetaceae bacterium]|nr:C-terminal helicase domain-containing protein [Sphaerochaetaceae bacterium]
NSRVNKKEVEIIIKIIEKIMANNKIFQKDVGVVTPYSEQAKLIKNNIRKYPELDVKTVDGFQGGEKKIIILSLVRANPAINSYNPIGFLNDMRRLNVSITRFEEKLIVVGDEKTLTSVDFDSNGNKIHFKDLFEYIKKNDFGEMIEGENKIIQYIENGKILISEGSTFEKKNPYSMDYNYLSSILKNKISPKYKTQFIIDKSMINNNVFTKKYFDLDYALGEKVRINLLDAITNVLGLNSDNDAEKWKYFDSENKRKKILLESIEENGKKTVLQTLNLAHDLIPIENPIRSALREDIEGLQVKNEEKIILNPPIESKFITPEIVDDNQKERIKLFEGFITQPDDGEANFNKIHNAIFKDIDKEVLLVDIQVRPNGIDNLSKHLKLISKIIDVEILTSSQAMIGWGNKNIINEYISKLHALSELTNKRIVVRLFKDEKEEHDRYAIIDKKILITLGAGLNILTSRKGTITSLPLNEDNSKQRDYYINYFNTVALDLNSDESIICNLVNKKIEYKNQNAM